MEITLPVGVAAFLIGFVLSLITGGALMYGAAASAPLLVLVAMAWSIGFLFVAAWVFDFFAGNFGGTRSFDQAFALLSLGMIPSVLGGILNAIPWIGWLLSLAASIYAIVLIYRWVPLFLGVPQEKRMVHFIVSLLVCFVINLVGAMVIGGAAATSMIMSGYDDAGTVTPTAGVLGSSMERQTDIMESAEKDTYDPPSDGELTDEQVEDYVAVLRKTRELRNRIGKKWEGKEEPEGVADIFSGMSDIVRATSAEMEVVKGGGGNWAEHLWVRDAIETARVQQDTSDAISHNYALYEKYREQIEAAE
jgi:hypothetical protein